MTVAMAGGGTGGHIFPGLAVAEALRARADCRIVWIGSRSRSDRALVEARGISYRAIPAGKLRRYFSLRNALDVFKILGGIAASLRALVAERPAVLFSKGGFVSVPPTVAAWLLRIPVVTHECDLTPGLATRLNALLARRVLVSFPETLRYLGPRAARVVVTGNPVRPEMRRADRERGRALLGVPERTPVLLVVGGSLGAGAMNSAVTACLSRLTTRCFVVHQRGAHPGEDSAPRYRSAAFFHAEFPDIIAAADLVVCRAGANSLSELSMLAKPAILVPLPLSSSRGDQITNAAHRSRAGAALVIPQSELDGERLAGAVEGLLGNPRRLAEMARAAAALAQPEAADAVARVLLEVSRRG